MAHVVITGGTLNFAVGAKQLQYDLCRCGELKDPDAEKCQTCHIDLLAEVNANKQAAQTQALIRQQARAQAAEFLVWRDSR